MRKLTFLSLLLIVISLTGCGGKSYRSITSLDSQEEQHITQLRHNYAKCIVKSSLKLDDGIIDPTLIVKNGEKECASEIEKIDSYLYRNNFSPYQTDEYINDIKKEEERKSLEAILRIRTK
ncbi:hypothetical protein [Maridesulfovibrio sp.]|uniref:hypothetical protein n=1 Tax=Maridesulfovibrio sp. TaxID=2795000 RepID=UPI0029CA184B|nr:hypothetical protein [Maridesulfovibrio sp.]